MPDSVADGYAFLTLSITATGISEGPGVWAVKSAGCIARCMSIRKTSAAPARTDDEDVEPSHHSEPEVHLKERASA